RICRKRFHISALTLGVNGVKRQRRLARPAHTGHHRNRVVRNLYADVFEVVNPRTADRQGVLTRICRDEFVARHRKLETAALTSAAQTSNYTVRLHRRQTLTILGSG